MKGKVRAELRSLYSPDADPIEHFAPDGPFGILVTAMVGPAGDTGEESFDFMLCTPEWFSSKMAGDLQAGRHYVFAREYNYANLERFVRDYCASCEGTAWSAVAEKVGRLGKWEFEDYVPWVEPPKLW